MRGDKLSDQLKKIGRKVLGGGAGKKKPHRIGVVTYVESNHVFNSIVVKPIANQAQRPEEKVKSAFKKEVCHLAQHGVVLKLFGKPTNKMGAPPDDSAYYTH